MQAIANAGNSYIEVMATTIVPKLYRGPNFLRALAPSSCHSLFDTHMSSLSAIFTKFSNIQSDGIHGQLTIFASTAPPRNTICRRRGGSSILTLNF